MEAVTSNCGASWSKQAIPCKLNRNVTEAVQMRGHLHRKGKRVDHLMFLAVLRCYGTREIHHATAFGIDGTFGGDKLTDSHEHRSVVAELGSIKFRISAAQIECIE